MDEKMLKRLEKMGGRVTTVQEFLGLSDAEMAEIEGKRPVYLTDGERESVRFVLECAASECEFAKQACSPEMLNSRGYLEKMAKRWARLAALFAAMLLSACHSWPLGAPPYAVCLDDSVSEADRATWRAEEERWNAEIGEPVLLDATSGCDVHVRAEPSLGEAACTLPADDEVRIFYVPADLEPCVALHELAHVMLGPGVHMAGTVLDPHGCDYPDVLAPVAARIREEWGMQ